MLNWSKYFFDQFLHRYLDQLFEGNWPVATSEHWTSQHTSTELGHARATLPILILHGQHWYWHFTWYKTPSEIDEAIKWDGNRQVVTVVLTELGHAQAMLPRHAHHFCLLALHIVLQYTQRHLFQFVWKFPFFSLEVPTETAPTRIGWEGRVRNPTPSDKLKAAPTHSVLAIM